MSAFYDFTLPLLNGTPQAFSAYRGKVVLVVNVASKCGLTPQYAGLEALWKAHNDQGLVILGFPCNQFAGQEPGTETEIAEFCEINYGVTFPLFGKIDVNGPDTSPLYAWLKAGHPGDVDWNFAKFLIGRDGAVVARFASSVVPGELEAPIVKLL
ncbi:MAG: glutathione peroxidase [Devosia sp.]|uniref:glutathione peroxidase n=1 Tax=Devosia sp. TaxID=1871048 RepID=UPI0026345268|nr:glutathione peroxidase [Devosia sp.]MDB5529871.1 glutathione peroxidase [Devosia sp.]